MKKQLHHLPTNRTLLLLSLFVLPVIAAFAQEEKEGERFNRHKLSLAITHTLVPTAIDSEGDKYWLALPSWSFDYDYAISKVWGMGLHSDVVIQNFEYEGEEEVIKKRTKPMTLALVGTRRLGKHLTVLGGGGAEFSTVEETLGLFRLGAEYGWELPNDWELSVDGMVDFKIKAYDAIVLGLAVGKSF